MKRFKNILVVWTGSVCCDDAVDQATALALANEARLTIAADCGTRTELRRQHERHKRLAQISGSIERIAGVPVATMLLRGASSDSIVQTVLRNGHDLVLVSRTPGTSSPLALRGNAKRDLITACPCPVWFLNPGQQVPYKRLLAVLDPCLDDGTDLPLNRKILEIAASLAARHGASLELVHAWGGPDRGGVRSGNRAADRAQMIAHHAALETLVRSVRPDEPPIEIHRPRTSPNAAIRDLVRHRDIDLIVMQADGGSNPSSLSDEWSVEALQDSLECSVLSVTQDRPEAQPTIAAQADLDADSKAAA